MADLMTVERIKVDLRISHNALDGDISDMIDACLRDLRVTAGVEDPDESDPLILSAIKLFVRASYTDDTKKAADYQTRYDAMKASLTMATGYGGDDVYD